MCLSQMILLRGKKAPPVQGTSGTSPPTNVQQHHWYVVGAIHESPAFKCIKGFPSRGRLCNTKRTRLNKASSFFLFRVFFFNILINALSRFFTCAHGEDNGSRTCNSVAACENTLTACCHTVICCDAAVAVCVKSLCC